MPTQSYITPNRNKAYININIKKKNSEVSEFSVLPYIQDRKLRKLGKCSFTSNFDSSCNLRCKNAKKITETKNVNVKIYFQKKKNTIFEVSEFSILPYTQNQKLGNLGKCSFTSNFDSCYNLRFRQKLKIVKWIKQKKRKLPRFPSFRFFREENHDNI